MTHCLSILLYFLKEIDDMSSTNPVSSHYRGDQKMLIGIVLLKKLNFNRFSHKNTLNNLKKLIPQFKKVKIG